METASSPGERLSEAEFASLVADAYEHLYDLIYLRTHPLLDLLVRTEAMPLKKRARKLHHLLLEAIGELDPGPQAPSTSSEWRRHRLMVQRYIKGESPQAVADALAISLRHYYRIHKVAIEDIAGVLWDRYVASPAAVPAKDEGSPHKEDLVDRLELLRLEVARAAQADRYTRLTDVIHGVISILEKNLRQRGVDVRVRCARSLPSTSVDQSLLRQILLGMLGNLAEQVKQGAIEINVERREMWLDLSMTIAPATSIGPGDDEEMRERLSALEEMAALAEAHVMPTYLGQNLVGLELQLPVAERSVLVVDDNEDMLQFMRSCLMPHGYRVITAQTAEEGLSKAVQFRPYAITLDLMMPEQDGWDLLQELLHRPETCHIPIIVCSVLKQKDLALMLGATAFLEKPVTEQELLSALERLSEA